MAGRGRAPKTQRQNPRDKPIRGEWQASEGIGWQHGEIPESPDGLKAETLRAWATWMRSWFASHWTPDDLPGLETTILLYDQVRRGEYQRATELRLSMDTYGITPKGQQDRRWSPGKAATERPAAGKTQDADPYAHLRVVS